MVLATFLFSAAIISFRPFQPQGAELAAGGDVVNQLGFGSLGALALFSLFALADRRVASALLSPWWLILLGFLAFSVLNALSPADALRAAIFTLIGMLAMAAALTLPRDADSFSMMLACSAFVILGLSYFGVIAMPGVAVHGADGFEPEHAGLWRGSFAHKNAAAPVMACLSFAGIYLWRRGWRLSGAIIVLLAIAFVANAGSKTTLATVPLAVLMVALPGLFGLRFLASVFLLTALVGTGLATLGIVFVDSLAALQKAYLPELTYTGRTTLWEFMGEMLAKRPWGGYGLESFWGTGTVFFADQPFDRAWDFRAIVHGHNSYLDLAIAMGIPALAAAIFAFVLAPVRDFLRVPPLKENVFLADLFLMIATFTLINAFLESFFFRRADPVWLFLVFALFGLRLVARFPVPARRTD
jgi:O-antigen ligase